MCGRFLVVTRDELDAIVAEVEREQLAYASRVPDGAVAWRVAPDSAASAHCSLSVASATSGHSSTSCASSPAASSGLAVPGSGRRKPQVEKPVQLQLDLFGDDQAEPIDEGGRKSSPFVEGRFATHTEYASAYPKSVVPVVTFEGGAVHIREMTWGFSVPWSTNVVFNARCEKAFDEGPNMWAESVAHRRCIVAARGFFEPHAIETVRNPKTGRFIKQQYLFTPEDSNVMFMAGCYQDGRFSILTRTPDSVVQPVHDRMPLMLARQDLASWLGSGYRQLPFASVALQSKPELPQR